MISLLLSLSLIVGVNGTKQEKYEDALPLLKMTESLVSKSNYNDYWFARAICHHQLMEKDEALYSLSKLQDSFEAMPKRHQSLAYLIEEDLKTWEDGLGNIERKMNNVRRRLEQAYGGAETQRQQKEIVRLLDEMIKEKEEAANLAKGLDKDGNEIQTGGVPNITPSSPAYDSKVMGGTGEGSVDYKKLQGYTESWGSMTPMERARVQDEVNRELPAKYKPIIDEYFKSLNKFIGIPR